MVKVSWMHLFLLLCCKIYITDVTKTQRDLSNSINFSESVNNFIEAINMKKTLHHSMGSESF